MICIDSICNYISWININYSSGTQNCLALQYPTASSTEREVHLEDHIFMDFVEKYIVPPNLIHNSTQLQKTTSCSSLVSQEPESEGTDS